MNTSDIPKEAFEQMKKEGWPMPEELKAYYERLTDRQVENLLRIGLEDHGGNVIPDRIQSNKERYRDYEPEQAYGTTEDFRKHQQYGGTREDY